MPRKFVNPLPCETQEQRSETGISATLLALDDGEKPMREKTKNKMHKSDSHHVATHFFARASFAGNEPAATLHAHCPSPSDHPPLLKRTKGMRESGSG